VDAALGGPAPSRVGDVLHVPADDGPNDAAPGSFRARGGDWGEGCRARRSERRGEGSSRP